MIAWIPVEKSLPKTGQGSEAFMVRCFVWIVPIHSEECWSDPDEKCEYKPYAAFWWYSKEYGFHSDQEEFHKLKVTHWTEVHGPEEEK